MDMIIYSETEFRSGLWYEKAMEGIRKNTSKKGINIKETDENTFPCLPADELFGEGKRLLTVIGASDRHMERLIPLCIFMPYLTAPTAVRRHSAARCSGLMRYCGFTW